MNFRSRVWTVVAATVLLAGLAQAQGKKTTASHAAAKETAAAEQGFTGEVSDSMCGKKHMMGGSSGAACTRACVKDGSDYALVVGDKVYTLKGDKATIDKFAGQQAKVTGKATGSTIQVASIAAAKS